MSQQLHLSSSNLADYLRGLGLLDPSEPIQVEKAGQGNINWVRRARRRDGSTVVVKQARPALERFPQYQVSTERIVFEARWYETVRPFDSDGICPQVIAFDERERVLVLEDLGDVPSLETALAAGTDVDAALERVAAFLGRVHAATRDPLLADGFANGQMQRLHGDHIFTLPLRPNDFPLEPALRRRADRLAADAELVAIADALYARYLQAGVALVHADVQGTNLLLTQRGPKLLDAEIAHRGDPAFDLGILLAHLLLPAPASQRARDSLRRTWSAYCRAHGTHDCPGFAQVCAYTGIELLRRTLGAARVPAVAELADAMAVLDLAERLLREPPASPERF